MAYIVYEQYKEIPTSTIKLMASNGKENVKHGNPIILTCIIYKRNRILHIKIASSRFCRDRIVFRTARKMKREQMSDELKVGNNEAQNYKSL